MAAWNKGLTKETDVRVRKYTESRMKSEKGISQFRIFQNKGTQAAAKLPPNKNQISARSRNGKRNIIKAYSSPITEAQREAWRKSAYRMGKANKGKTGEKCFHWKGGISYFPYSIKWTEELRDKIRARDNFQCQNKKCGMTQEEHLIVFGVDLNVHHIDYDKMNCKESNLISTCHGCNSRANFNRDIWKKYYQELMEKKSCLPV